MTRHIRHTRPTGDVRHTPPHHFPLPLNRRLIGAMHPITHRTRRRHLPIPVPSHSRMRSIFEYILIKAINSVAAVGGGYGGGAIAALFERRRRGRRGRLRRRVGNRPRWLGGRCRTGRGL